MSQGERQAPSDARPRVGLESMRFLRDAGQLHRVRRERDESVIYSSRFQRPT
jgi:hypothetical protein